MSEEHHPIRNGLIVGVILLVLGAVTRLVPATWAVVTKAVAWLARQLGVAIILPAWFVAIMALALCILLVRRVVAWWPKGEPTWQEYTQDTFLGIVWRWEYSSVDDEIIALTPYCPEDDTELKGEFEPDAREPHTRYRCDLCGAAAEFDYSAYQDPRDWVRRQIERKIRSGEWREVVGQTDR